MILADSSVVAAVTEEVLPEGWAWGTLADGLAVDIQPGFACGGHNRTGEGIPHLRPMNVNENGSIDLNVVKFVPLAEANRDERCLRPGDVLFNNTNSPELVGKTAYYGLTEPRAFSNHMTRVRCHTHSLDPQYCAMFLHQQWREQYFASVCNNHVSQASIGRSVLQQTPIPLPPLAEQKRIVAKVEEVLGRVTAARERLAKAPAILKRFRQAVLAAACSGRLTADWREDDSPDSDLPDGWAMRAAGDFYVDARYGTSVKCDREGVGTPVLRVPNIAKGVLDLSDLKSAELSSRELKALAVEEGDLIVCRTNGSLDLIGKTAVIPPIDQPYAFASYLIRLRLNREQLLPDYFHAFLSGPTGRDQIEAKARTTAGQFNLNLEILRSLQTPQPPLAEQSEIIRRVCALFKLANAIGHRVSTASRQVDKLTQGVLAKAFRGELVPTEAELARAEGRDYEPASVLLDRVRAERAASSSPKPSRHRKT